MTTKYDKIPAITSSAITPNPLGKDSIFLTGPNLEISNSLKERNPITPVYIFTGSIVNAIHWPTHSSITILEGS